MEETHHNCNVKVDLTLEQIHVHPTDATLDRTLSDVTVDRTHPRVMSQWNKRNQL